MPLKTFILAAAVLLSASTVCLAQSMPNYGPNAPATGDSFGKPPSATRPPGVSRSAHSAYAYRRYHHHRHVHPRPPQD
jgi:hypothetical protein